jgi:hypothetical protein
MESGVISGYYRVCERCSRPHPASLTSGAVFNCGHVVITPTADHLSPVTIMSTARLPHWEQTSPHFPIEKGRLRAIERGLFGGI